VERVKDLLESSQTGLDEIAAAVGFGSQETLRHHFRAKTGVSPTAFRRAFAA
jgi:AraC family transcriptional activator FtrA